MAVRATKRLWYHAPMRSVLRVAALVVVVAVPLGAADLLSEARRLYNVGPYDNAERLARQAERTPATANAARIVLGRILLERYRRSGNSQDLTDARTSLRTVDPAGLDGKERVELVIGLAESLYLENLFGAAAELFGVVLERSSELGPAAHERVFDWWATASDRQAQASRPADRPSSGSPTMDRQPVYDRLLGQATAEVARDPGFGAGIYWLVKAARDAGDLDRAWSAAMAGWTLAPLTADRGAALRADLDRLVVQAIVPDRAARLAQRERSSAVTA